MNILMVTDFSFSSIGGVQSSVKSQVDELRNQGHRVIVLCPSDKREYGHTNEDIFYVPSFRFLRVNDHVFASPLSYSLPRVARDLGDIANFDIVHSQTTATLGAQARQLADILTAPLVQTMHGRDDVFFQRTMRFPRLVATCLYVVDRTSVRKRKRFPLSRLSFVARLMWDIMLNRADRADAVTIPSQHFAKKFVDKGLDPNIVIVISNGIADAIIETIEPSTPSTKHPLSLVWASRLSAEKQPDLAIRSVAAVEDITLDIYGDGPMRMKCQKIIEELDVSERVYLRGAYKADDIYQIMNKHDALLYTSYDFDNQPMVMLEATVAGLPVIFCDPDLEECLPAGGGILSSSPDAQSISAALKTIATDDKKRRTMRNVLLRERDNYRQSVHTSNMLELYKTVRKRTMR
jgi:1,2-diacylglycerol 3-alpha-glucosyltransferase